MQWLLSIIPTTQEADWQDCSDESLKAKSEPPHLNKQANSGGARL
jgi:hypothetical protein